MLLVQSSGTLEFQADYRSTSTSVYRTGFRNGRLVRGTHSDSVLALADGRCDVVRSLGRGLTATALKLPLDATDVAACASIGPTEYLVVNRVGDLWLVEANAHPTPVASAMLPDVSTCCVLSADIFLLGSAHGEVAILRRAPTALIARKRCHADAIQDIVPLNGDMFATVSRDRSLRVWSTAPGMPLAWSLEALHEHFINCAARVGGTIWTGSSDGTIAIVNIDTKNVRYRSRRHMDAVRVLDVSRDASRILSLSDDGTWKIHDTESGSEVYSHGTLRHYIRSGDFRVGEGGVNVVFGSTSGLLRHGSLDENQFSESPVSSASLRAVRFVDERAVAVGDDAHALRLFDLHSKRSLAIAGADTGFTVLRVDQPSDRLLSGDRDGWVRIHRLPTSVSNSAEVPLAAAADASEGDPSPLECLAAAKIHESIVGDLLVTASGLLFTCSDDQSIRIVLADTLRTLRTTALDSTAINNLLILGASLIATTDGGSILVLDRDTHEVRKEFAEHSGPVRAICAVSDHTVVTGDRNGEIWQWRIDTLEGGRLHKFRDRVIELAYDARRGTLLVITEGEVASVGIEQAPLPTEVESAESHGWKSSHGGVRAAVLSDTVSLDAIELTLVDKSLHISKADRQLLREFTRSRGGLRCTVRALGGGLSDARVFMLRIYDGAGALRINAVAKIASRDVVAQEIANYDSEVARLAPGATPRRLHWEPSRRSGDSGSAVFFSLAEGYEQSAFDVTERKPQLVSRVVTALARLTAPWHDRVPETRSKLADMRRAFLSDDRTRVLVARHGVAWSDEFEEQEVQIRMCTVHADLHAGNVLVDFSGRATLIDFGSIRQASATIDPVTFELSHWFHPEGRRRRGAREDLERAKRWMTDEYLEWSALGPVSSETWRWAEAVCAGHREIAAAAYIYLLVQLSYKDTDKELALGFLEGAKRLFEAT